LSYFRADDTRSELCLVVNSFDGIVACCLARIEALRVTHHIVGPDFQILASIERTVLQEQKIGASWPVVTARADPTPVASGTCFGMFVGLLADEIMILSCQA